MRRILVLLLAGTIIIFAASSVLAAHIPTYDFTGVNFTATNLDQDGNHIDSDPQDQAIWQNFCAGYVTELNGTQHDPIPVNTAQGNYGDWCANPDFDTNLPASAFVNNTDPNFRARMAQLLVTESVIPPGQDHVYAYNNVWINYITYTHTTPPPDLCTNLPGDQATIPEGYEDPEPDGICTEIPPPPAENEDIIAAIELQTIQILAGATVGAVIITIVKVSAWKP